MVAVPLETECWVTVHQEVTEATNQQQEIVAMDQPAQGAMDLVAQTDMEALVDTVRELSVPHMNFMVATVPHLLP
jgi:hypothetical protein